MNINLTSAQTMNNGIFSSGEFLYGIIFAGIFLVVGILIQIIGSSINDKRNHKRNLERLEKEHEKKKEYLKERIFFKKRLEYFEKIASFLEIESTYYAKLIYFIETGEEDLIKKTLKEPPSEKFKIGLGKLYSDALESTTIELGKFLDSKEELNKILLKNNNDATKLEKNLNELKKLVDKLMEKGVKTINEMRKELRL